MDAQAPLFTNKAELFRDSAFVVGYDTAVRLIDPKYYKLGDSDDGTEGAFTVPHHAAFYRGSPFRTMI